MAMSSAGPELGEAQRQVAKYACGGPWRQLLLCHSLAAEAAPACCRLTKDWLPPSRRDRWLLKVPRAPQLFLSCWPRKACPASVATY